MVVVTVDAVPIGFTGLFVPQSDRTGASPAGSGVGSDADDTLVDSMVMPPDSMGEDAIIKSDPELDSTLNKVEGRGKVVKDDPLVRSIENVKGEGDDDDDGEAELDRALEGVDDFCAVAGIGCSTPTSSSSSARRSSPSSSSSSSSPLLSGSNANLPLRTSTLAQAKSIRAQSIDQIQLALESLLAQKQAHEHQNTEHDDVSTGLTSSMVLSALGPGIIVQIPSNTGAEMQFISYPIAGEETVLRLIVVGGEVVDWDMLEEYEATLELVSSLQADE